MIAMAAGACATLTDSRRHVGGKNRSRRPQEQEELQRHV